MGSSTENPPIQTDFPIKWFHSGQDLATVTLLKEGLRFFWQRSTERHESSAGLVKTRDKRLRQMITLAAQRSPFYRERFDKAGIDAREIRSVADLARLPVLERQDLSTRAADLLARPPRSGTGTLLRWVRTSGSSGTPVTVALSSREFVTNIGLILEGFLRCGWKPWHKVATVCVPTHPRKAPLFSRLGLMRELIVDLREGAEANLQQLVTIQPELIYGYPSQLALIARQLEQIPQPRLQPHVVVTNGEFMDSKMRSRIGRAFRAPVRETYGSAEFHRIGTECSHGVIHINSTMIWVETDPQTLDENGAADALVTSLYQHAMPLIRYRLGDRITWTETPCPCGSNHPCLREISGRREEFVHLPSGRQISPRAINLLEEIPAITAFQLIQYRPDSLEVRVDAACGADDQLDAAICRVLREGLADEPVRIRVLHGGEFLRSSHGKIPAFVSRLGGSST